MRKPENILVIRFSSMGDILLTSPLVRILRSALPNARIDFLVKSTFADLLKFNPHISSLIEVNSEDRNELDELRKQIRKTRYDLILDLHNSLRSRWIRFGSRARNIRVVNKRVVPRFMLVKLKKNYYENIVPVVERYIETVASLGINNDGKGLEVFIPEDLRSVVRSRFSRLHLDSSKTVIGLVPGAKHFTKRWPQERFVEFGKNIAGDSSTRILIFGGKDEADYCTDIAQLMNTACGSNIAESFAGRLSLLETASAFDFCDVVVTNDTGLMHLAAARQKKIVAIFGSTVREFGFFPYGVAHTVVENANLPCRPCSHIGLAACPESHFKCMNEIAVADVIAATRHLIGDAVERSS